MSGHGEGVRQVLATLGPGPAGLQDESKGEDKQVRACEPTAEHKMEALKAQVEAAVKARDWRRAAEVEMMLNATRKAGARSMRVMTAAPGSVHDPQSDDMRMD